MPSSWPAQIGPVLNLILAIEPRSILDIGAGFGKYGVLCREYLDVIPGARSGSSYPPPRRVVIDCIEACAEYVSPIHHYVYDRVYLGDALALLPTLARGSYELALVIDVLEHFSREEGSQFMKMVLAVADTALIATPTTEMPQGAIFGNEYERHRSRWRRDSLRGLAPASRFFSGVTAHTGHICLLSASAGALKGFSRRARALAWIGYRTALLERLHLRDPLRRVFRRGRAAGPGASLDAPGG
jgi:hypothetical protein